jgi:hypothetical protein
MNHPANTRLCQAWGNPGFKIQAWGTRRAILPRIPDKGSAGNRIRRKLTLGECMTITLEIRPEVQAEIARQARIKGRAMEAHAATILEEAVRFPHSESHPAFDLERAKAAGSRILEIGNGPTLGGLTVRELIDEGRA